MVLCILNKKEISSLEPVLCPHWAMPYPHSEQFRIQKVFRSKKLYTRLRKFRADYTPAVFAFVLHTGVKGEPVLTGDGKAAAIVIVDL